MPRQLTLVIFCLFTCCALVPCAWGDPAPAGDAAGGKPVVRRIDLHYISAKELVQMLTAKLKATENAHPDPPGQPSEKSGSLAELVPSGVESIIGVTELNSLVVRAKSEDDINQLQLLINLLDQPRASVLVDVLFIKSTIPLIEPEQITAQAPDANPKRKGWYLHGSPAQFLAEYIKQNKMAIPNVARLTVQNGCTGAFTTGGKESGITAIEVNKLTVYQDNTAEMDVALRMPFVENVTTLTVRAKSGEACIVKIGEQGTAEKATCYAIITPTILKQNDTIYDGSGMKTLPPLF